MAAATGWHRLGVVSACVVAAPILLITLKGISNEPYLLLIPAVMAILVYALVRGIGWVVGGFQQSK